MNEKYDSSMPVTRASFWQSINVLITKPHIVNKRLWGCKLICEHHFNNLPCNFEVFDNITLDNATNVNKSCTELIQKLKQVADESATDVEVVVMELLPKNYSETHAFQLICLYKSDMEVRFIDITPSELKQNLSPTFSYGFGLKNGQIELIISSDISAKSKEWLKNTTLPQVIKWSAEYLQSNVNKTYNKSLALVSHHEYYKKYNNLKIKYGKEMVKIWPECTDPSKFVYEDIAIATYLLILWKEETDPKTFVDIGCGNGLLVYILTMEGYSGFGVDVRKRKIWDMYPQNIVLKEITIDFSNIHIFGNVDWIIGNHSDELTPWIPVITAKSSYKCNFFLLPCCAYNFDGTKYQRQNASKSQYAEYLEYIENLCNNIGFKVQIDRLKIPSTKRICLIGRERTYIESDYDKYCSIIQDFLHEQIGITDKTDDKSELKTYKTRDPVEKVRNCTQIDKSVTEYIVKNIADYLLEGCSIMTTWSRGKKVIISDLVKLIPADKLKALKSECGGLQTLLKNHHSIFEVCEGYVQLRYPRTVDEVIKKIGNKKTYTSSDTKVKVKQCWFYSNHPQGCPLDNNICSFRHDK